MINFNEMQDEEEFYQGEVHDFILELVKKELERYPENEFNRRKELCQKILETNKPIGVRSKIKETIVNEIKSTPIAKINLEKIGVRILINTKHTKIKFHEKPYAVIVSKTPKDRSANQKTINDIVGKFF